MAQPPAASDEIKTNTDENAGHTGAADADVDYSVFTSSQRRYIVFMASWAGFFSPVSSQIYFPALNTLARDLRVSNSLINLTLTSYMVRRQRTMILAHIQTNMLGIDLPRTLTYVHR